MKAICLILMTALGLDYFGIFLAARIPKSFFL